MRPDLKLRQVVGKNKLFRIRRVFGNEQYEPYIRTEIRRFYNGRVVKGVSERSPACPESKKTRMFSTSAQIIKRSFSAAFGRDRGLCDPRERR
jgi:hypothetical protein